MPFKLESFFNPCLAPGTTRVDAIFTITSDGNEESLGPGGPKCVAFLIDCSASMFRLGKIEAAKHALRRCLTMLPPDVYFCVIAFGTTATVEVAMTQASEGARREADRIVQSLRQMGGTNMSTVLAAARAEFATLPGAIASAYFLTDGLNEGEERQVLVDEIARCEGAFQCDCRGVGTDWTPDELRLISNALLGTSDAIADPASLEADFRAALAKALTKETGDVRLDLWQPGTSRLVSLRQMQPETVDITSQGVAVSVRVTSFRLGAWGREQRDYYATFDVTEGDVDDEMLVCRPTVIWSEAGTERKAQGTKIVATWSHNADLTARISPEVAHYTGQGELANAIKEGLEARGRGNAGEATRLLGRAARIAYESGNEDVTRRLAKVVDLVDAQEGTVRLKAADKGAALELEMGGTRTVRRSPKS